MKKYLISGTKKNPYYNPIKPYVTHKAEVRAKSIDEAKEIGYKEHNFYSIAIVSQM